MDADLTAVLAIDAAGGTGGLWLQLAAINDAVDAGDSGLCCAGCDKALVSHGTLLAADPTKPAIDCDNSLNVPGASGKSTTVCCAPDTVLGGVASTIHDAAVLAGALSPKLSRGHQHAATHSEEATVDYERLYVVTPAGLF